MLNHKDQETVRAQINREPRGVIEVAHRCACGAPDVLKTSPRLPDGTPFPTLFYLTCPRAVSFIGTLEANGVMKQFEQELSTNIELAVQYQKAHDDYLKAREAIMHVGEIDGVSAGGMPTRVKCLHVLVAHSLACGPGVNPLGDKALAMLKDWATGPACIAEAKVDMQ